MEFDPKKIDILLNSDRGKIFGHTDDVYARRIKRHNKSVRTKIVESPIPENEIKNILPAQPVLTPNQLLAASGITSIIPESKQLDITPAWIKDSVAKQKKLKQQKKKSKKKKKQKAAMETLSYLMDERGMKAANAMAEYVKASSTVIKVDGSLWLYDEEDGSYHLCDENELSTEMREALPEELQMKTSSREYTEAYKQLNISKDIIVDNTFNVNTPYVNCLSGVVDARTGELLDHDPSFLFKSCIQSRYTPDAEFPKFQAYLDLVTDGDKELQRLFRCITGYLISDYTNAKSAVIAYGPPHTGKSLYCCLIEKIIGSEYVAHVDFDLLQKVEFVASLQKKKVNIAPDITTKVMKDPGFFKALLSPLDAMDVREVYGKPITVRDGCKMLFASNHMIQLDSTLETGDLEATFNRFQYLPFLNKPITREMENRNLAEEIFAEEKDAIFTWAIEGIRDYIEFNGFPPCEAAESLKRRNMAMYCSEKYFVSECLKLEVDRYESSELVKKAYKAFCQEIGVQPKNIGKYLIDQEKIVKDKVRVDSDGYKDGSCGSIRVYAGIRLRKKYRQLALEDTSVDDENEIIEV